MDLDGHSNTAILLGIEMNIMRRLHALPNILISVYRLKVYSNFVYDGNIPG